MEVKAEREDAGEVHESYAMLVVPDAMTRRERALSRKLCISHIFILILILTCTGFCVLLYMQWTQGSKDNENLIKEEITGPRADKQNGLKNDDNDVPPSPISVLGIVKVTKEDRANLTWKANHRMLNESFCKKESCDWLTIPKNGRYEFSLQITYGEMSANLNPRHIDLSHNIIVYQAGNLWKPQTILSVFDTVDIKERWMKSIFSQNVYVLQEKDIVVVQSNNYNLIYFDGQPWTKTFLTVQFDSNLPN